MKTDGLPESNMVADRRNKPVKVGPMTMQEMREFTESEPQPDIRPNPDTDPELPKKLGSDDIAKILIERGREWSEPFREFTANRRSAPKR